MDEAAAEPIVLTDATRTDATIAEPDRPSICAMLFDADQGDRPIEDVTAFPADALSDRQLLWVDLQSPAGSDLHAIATQLSLPDASIDGGLYDGIPGPCATEAKNFSSRSRIRQDAANPRSRRLSGLFWGWLFAPADRRHRLVQLER